MSNEAFEKVWEDYQVPEGSYSFRKMALYFWQACDAHLHGPMACGHQRSELEFAGLACGLGPEGPLHRCRACEADAKARDAALLAVEDSLNGILSGHRAVGLPTGEIEICRNVVVRLRERK